MQGTGGGRQPPARARPPRPRPTPPLATPSPPQLNAARLRPAACPRTDRLARTPLQLPPGAALVLDETGLTPGHLTPTGADSAAALAELLGADKAVAYDYCGVRHPVPAHGGGVVLENRRGGGLSARLHLPRLAATA